MTLDAVLDRPRAVVVLSGGQDSTTCLYVAKKAGLEVFPITFDYGQRHRCELLSAFRIAVHAGLAHRFRLVRVPSILRSTSPLTSSTPLETYQSFDQMEGVIGDRVEKTFVPLRNPFFLLIAANYALSLGAKFVMTGVCEEDNANYPDCRAGFLSAFHAMVEAALGPQPGLPRDWLQAPLLHLTKSDTVKLAASMSSLGAWAALALSHTCYAGKTPPCGECHSCVLRAHGFAEAGFTDPLVDPAFAPFRKFYEETIPETLLDSLELTGFSTMVPSVRAEL